ncbi:c-type cytochrome [Alloacidobacterium dinghuense]|uniref:Photosynthetic reaction center cytochrome c subunit n=1 Tax=Alloacidobacterium dinghuense TaxID=2763107 RepID=A0A7G8BEX5_9BACT|nr:c-type cytochrome [Alloacidobacterium dinghuense]QNI31095.1 c-type cytochrome [Alloacidobacterium dinghuense]
MKRVNTCALVAAFLACTSLALIAQDAPAAAPQARRPMPAPTNLQVLPKDIAPQDLMKMMFGYSQALGVQCPFCHEVNEQTHQPNFAADTKPDKKIARTMIAMVQDINSKYMTQIDDPDAKPADKTVTCGTCHRGNTMPAQFVPKAEEHGNAMQMKKPE